MQGSDQKPWWRRWDGVPPAFEKPPKGRVDRWAIEKPAVAAIITALGVGVVWMLVMSASLATRVLVGLGFAVVFGLLQWAVLDLRRRHLSEKPNE